MASTLPRAGFKLIVRDADPTKEVNFVRDNPGAVVAKKTSDAFQDAEVIITMLPQGKVVRDVLLGEDGIASALKPGMTLKYKPLHSVIRLTRS